MVRKMLSNFEKNAVCTRAFNTKEINQMARSYAEDVRQVMPVEKAFLFGSYAKGEASELSDVDICFFLKDFNGKQRVEIITEMLSLSGKYTNAAIEPLAFESAEMQNGNPFVCEILATGKELL